MDPSIFNQNYFWLPVVGFVVGILVTMFGGGGGFFYVPVLTLLFKFPTHVAIEASLATMIPTTIVGFIEHYKKGNVNIKIGLIFGIAGLAGTLIGAFLSHLLHSDLLRKLFGIYAIVLIVPMILTNRRKYKKVNISTRSQNLSAKEFLLSSFFGIISGLMAGFFGASGTASIVAGLYILGFPVTVVVGTSVLVVLFNGTTGFVSHLLIGEQFNFLIILLLALGAGIGAFIGPELLSKINVEVLEKVYGVLFILLVIVFGVLMMLK